MERIGGVEIEGCEDTSGSAEIDDIVDNGDIADTSGEDEGDKDVTWLRVILFVTPLRPSC